MLHDGRKNCAVFRTLLHFVCEVAEQFDHACDLESIHVVRLCRVTAFQKGSGKVRGVVVGKIVRGPIARASSGSSVLLPWLRATAARCAPRVFETRVSCSDCRPTTCDAHALGGAQCGEQRRLD